MQQYNIFCNKGCHKPRKMMGLESQGMMLFAQDDGTWRSLTISEAVRDGAGVR